MAGTSLQIPLPHHGRGWPTRQRRAGAGFRRRDWHPPPPPSPLPRWGRESSFGGASASLLHLALLRLDALLGLRVDPPGIEAEAVFGRDFGAAKLVPVADPERPEMELRDHVVAVLQDPVERMGMRNQAGAVGRPDQFLDQLVDNRALDP